MGFNVYNARRLFREYLKSFRKRPRATRKKTRRAFRFFAKTIIHVTLNGSRAATTTGTDFGIERFRAECNNTYHNSQTTLSSIYHSTAVAERIRFDYYRGLSRTHFSRLSDHGEYLHVRTNIAYPCVRCLNGFIFLGCARSYDKPRE